VVKVDGVVFGRSSLGMNVLFEVDSGIVLVSFSTVDLLPFLELLPDATK
jgi:hypothetical protein